MQVAPLAAAFVGYVVFWNLSLQMNSVGFYQLSKIMVLPSVAALEVSLPHHSHPGLCCMSADQRHPKFTCCAQSDLPLQGWIL